MKINVNSKYFIEIQGAEAHPLGTTGLDPQFRTGGILDTRKKSVMREDKFTIHICENQRKRRITHAINVIGKYLITYIKYEHISTMVGGLSLGNYFFISHLNYYTIKYECAPASMARST